jgi:hypothetical protein
MEDNMTNNIIDMPNTADTINKAVDMVHAAKDEMFKITPEMLAEYSEAVKQGWMPQSVYDGLREAAERWPIVHSNEEKEHMRKILEGIVAKHPDYKRRSPEALANLYFDLRFTPGSVDVD